MRIFRPLPSHKILYFEADLSKVNQTKEYKQEEENVIRFTSFKINGSVCGGSAPKQEKETVLLTSKINKIIDGVKVGNRYFKGEKNTNVNVSSQEKKDFTSLQVHVHQLDSTKSTWLHVILGPTWRLTLLFPSQTRLCSSYGSRLSSQQFPHSSLGSRRHLSPFDPTIFILIFSPPILTTHSNSPFFPNKPIGF